MKRGFAELVDWLVRDNPLPPGSVLLTGTGLVPPDDFTLQPGHKVEIHVPGIGTLQNDVVLATDLLPERTHHDRDAHGGARPQLGRRRVARQRHRRDIREAQSLAAVGRDRVYRRLGCRRRAAAVEAAREAFPGWAGLPAAQRAAFFFKAADALEARSEQIAQDMTAEMGKPLREARGEAARTAPILRFSAGEAFRPSARSSSRRSATSASGRSVGRSASSG